MLLRILKSNTLLSSLLIPLAGGLFWMHNFKTPVSLDVQLANGAMPLYHLIYNLVKEQAFWQTFIAFSLVLLNSFFVAQLGSTFLFIKKRSYLPGILYMITVSSLPELQALLPVHMATLCVLIALYFIFDTYHRSVEIAFTFNASFFIALATLFYLPALVLLPLVWIAVFVLQKSDNPRLLVIPIIGFSVPCLFMWAFLFLKDGDQAFGQEIMRMIWTRHNAYLFNPFFLALTAVVTFISILGSISVISSWHRFKVSARKYFVIFYWMLGLLMLSALGLMTIGVEIIVLLTIPVSYFVSNFLLSDQKTFWLELLTWIYVGTMVLALLFYIPK